MFPPLVSYSLTLMQKRLARSLALETAVSPATSEPETIHLELARRANGRPGRVRTATTGFRTCSIFFSLTPVVATVT